LGMFRVRLLDEAHVHAVWMGGGGEETLEGLAASFAVAEVGDGYEDGGFGGAVAVGWDGVLVVALIVVGVGVGVVEDDGIMFFVW